MKADLDTTTYKLSLAIFIILVAFISYSLGRNSQSLPPEDFADYLARIDLELFRRESQFASLNSIAHTAHEQQDSSLRSLAQEQLENKSNERVISGNKGRSMTSGYDKGFQDGLAISLRTKLHDLQK
jgi:hypothetical protein